MKNKILLLMLFSALMVVSSVHLSSAEIYSWNNVIIDTSNNLVTHHGFYTLDDTPYNKAKTNLDETFNHFKQIPIRFLYNVQALPYNLTYGSVDWCNFTIMETHNQYSGILNNVVLSNYTTTTTSYYFTTNASGQLTFYFSHRDTIVADMSCHYTNASSLYQDNILFGRFDTIVDSYSCGGGQCRDYTLEELSHATDTADAVTTSQLTIFNGIQTLIEWNYKFWLYGYWFFKLGLLLLALAMIFVGIYWIYQYIRRLVTT